MSKFVVFNGQFRSVNISFINIEDLPLTHANLKFYDKFRSSQACFVSTLMKLSQFSLENF